MPTTSPWFKSPVPADAPPPVVKLTVWAQTKRGCHVLYQQSRAWTLLEGIDDETLHKQIAQKRSAENRKAIREHRKEVRELQRQADAAAKQSQAGGHYDGRSERLQQAYTARASIGPVLPHTDDEITEQDVKRHRLGKQAGRCAMVAASVVGALMLSSQHPVLLLASLLGGFGAAWWAGRHREPGDKESSQVGMSADGITISPATPSAAAAGPVVLSADSIAEGADRTTYPIARARTVHEAADCLLRAFQAKNLDVGEIINVERHHWGWQMVVRVLSGTPAALIAAAGDLETSLDLPAGGFVPQPMAERRACAIIRLRMSDPFTQAPTLPYRAPKSASIRDKARFGTSIGGDALEFSVAGVMGLAVAASGGGKTGDLQAVGEFVTSCYDCITIDLDPHGDGLEDLHDAVRLTGRSHRQIEATLLFLFMLSKGRARLRGTFGMGKKWEPSAERPAVFVIIDEFPKLSALAKLLAFELLLVGRKEGVWVLLASQGGTTRYLGENFAQMLSLQIVGPCKTVDTRQVFGDGMIAEGWLPHRLNPATDTDPKDAGHAYILGMPGRANEPIEYKFHEVPAAVLRKLAVERREAGLLDLDAESLAAMQGVDLPDFVEPVFDLEGNLKKEAPVELLTWERLLKLCDAEPPAPALRSTESKVAAAAVIDALAVMDHAGADRIRTERLVEALRAYSPDSYGDLTPDALRALLREGGAGSPVGLGAMDNLSNPRGYKREALEGAA
jgi:S-DNA-T family DNA segregation ATPase FtsK/SpoIIIE